MLTLFTKVSQVNRIVSGKLKKKKKALTIHVLNEHTVIPLHDIHGLSWPPVCILTNIHLAVLLLHALLQVGGPFPIAQALS